MRQRVLVTAPYMQPVLARFRREFEARGIEVEGLVVDERLGEEELLPLVPEFDGIICGDDQFTDRVLAAALRLRVIVKWGTGIDSIDTQACALRGVQVRNTPGAFTGPVADSVLGYILAFARRHPWMNKAMKQGVWEKIPGHSLSERTLGILGVGAIGRAVARRARAFGMPALGNDIRPVPEEFLRETGVRMVDKAALYAESDYVSINCDLNPTSRHLLGRAEFAAMRKNAILINTARGGIVDETALIDALRLGEIGGAALDVFEEEPLPPDSPLREMDNVILAPHNSNSSPAAWERVHRNTVAQLLEVLGMAGAQ
jgi:D-3-phosphoglycerate dehydrogenase / 2-oxoglutarate reductase